jgi:hypothetical protein
VKGEEDLRTAIGLYQELASLLGEIQAAVVRADTEKLAGLVPQQEELLRRVADLRLPSAAPRDLAAELERTAAEALRRNTQNSVLLREQLALIQVTMKAILGEGSAVNRLA